MASKESKYLVNANLFILGSVYAVFLIIIGISLLTISRFLSAFIFIALSIPFFIIVYRYGSYVVINKDGVFLKFLNFERRHFFWNDIKEINIIGSNILNRKNRKRCGTIYIIFSEKTRTEGQNVDMILKWPPKDEIYLKFSKEILLNIQQFYLYPVKKYNVGMLDI